MPILKNDAVAETASPDKRWPAMNEQQLITFLEVAKRRHFRHAAEALNLTQPAVSAQIRSLEEELDTTLFTRTHVKLTESGSRFLPYAKQIVALIQEGREAVSDLNRAPVRPVTIGVAPGLALAILPRLAGYFAPGGQTGSVRLLTLPEEELGTQLAEGQIDAAIAYKIESLPAFAECKTLFYDTFRLIVPADDPRFRPYTYLCPEELQTLPMIVHAPGSPERTLLNKLFQRHQLHLQIWIEVNGTEEIKQLVAAGFGCAFVPASSLWKPFPEIRHIPVIRFGHSFPVVLCHPEKRYLTRFMNRLLLALTGIYPAEED
jgi:DNA-binding transcriptional LysR family regulator